MAQMNDFQLFIKVNKLKQKQVAEYLGTSVQYINQVVNGKCALSADKYEMLANSQWDTSMLNLPNWLRLNRSLLDTNTDTDTDTDADPDTERSVLLLPISAIGGSLTGFDPSVAISDCERILSPINGADFAIEVYGDSMAPEYPSGARILIKRIDMEAFIEWGRVYVLATTNGTVIKEVFPHGEEAVECRSVNATYPPFFIRYKDIHAMYRVLMCMTLK